MLRVAPLLLLLLIAGLWPRVGRANSPACVTSFTLLQSTQSTPARVIGTPDEHLAMLAYHPQYDAKVHPKPADMYLVTGDVVDVIASCENYAYVRYQGRKLVSTGWVEKSRLQDIGAPHPRPRDTITEVCAAAANTANRNYVNSGYFTGVQQIAVPTTIQEKVTIGDDNVAAVYGMSKVIIDGRILKIFTVGSQGSASSSYLRIWTNSLSKLVADTDAGLGFGGGQALVQVLGHPLVLQVHYTDQTKFSLARIDKNGALHVICSADMGYAPEPRVVFGHANPVCRAVINNHVAVVTMRFDRNGTIIQPENPVTHGTSKFTLDGVARVDLFNDGDTRNIGLVSFSGYFADPYGGYPTFATFPAILDTSGNVDLNDSVNKQLIKDVTGLSAPDQFFQVRIDGRLVKYAGRTFFVTYDETNGGGASLDTVAGVRSFSSNGAKPICAYQSKEFIVRPTDGAGTEATP